jgi:Fur family transcriptional regulator, ferric uptake regulator
MKHLALYDQILRQAKLSNTKTRRHIFTTLYEQAKPITMSELIAITSSHVDRASIYRIIELFIQAGIVHKIYTGWKYRLELSELFMAHHHHFFCQTCGKIISFQEPETMTSVMEDLRTQYGITITQHDFEIRGTCKDCTV